MKKIFILLMLLLVVLLGCSSEETSDKISVMTTVDPVYDMVTKIGGEYVEVASTYPAGVDIHEYELTSKDMAAVVESDILFYISHSSDHFVEDLENSGEYDVKFINITEHEKFKSNVESSLYGTDGIIDPHVWLSPKMNMLIADVITSELCSYDETNCEYYTNNYNDLINELTIVDNLYSDFAAVQTHSIIVSHEAFSYLTYDYGIEFINVYGLTHDSEPTSKDIQGIVDYINENNITHIFCDSTDMENKMMLQIQSETGAEIVPIYNLEAVDEMYFIDQLTKNIESMSL